MPSQTSLWISVRIYTSTLGSTYLSMNPCRCSMLDSDNAWKNYRLSQVTTWYFLAHCLINNVESTHIQYKTKIRSRFLSLSYSGFSKRRVSFIYSFSCEGGPPTSPQNTRRCYIVGSHRHWSTSQRFGGYKEVPCSSLFKIEERIWKASLGVWPLASVEDVQYWADSGKRKFARSRQDYNLIFPATRKQYFAGFPCTEGRLHDYFDCSLCSRSSWNGDMRFRLYSRIKWTSFTTRGY